MESLQFVFGNFPQRYILGVMSCLAFVQLFIMRNNILDTLEKMVKHPYEVGKESTECPGRAPGYGNESLKNEFEWDRNMQQHMHQAFYYGYMIMQIPGGMMADKYGGKHVVSIAVLSSAIFIFLAPSSAYSSQYVFLLNRFMIGFCSGSFIPAVSSMIARWTPVSERGLAGGFILSGFHLGNALGRFLIFQALQYFHWNLSYYTIGTTSVIWYIMWCILVYNDPQSHPFITAKEKAYLEENVIDVKERKYIPPPPFKKILSNMPLLSILICHFGDMWGLHTIQNELPRYLTTVLKFPVNETFIVTTIQFLFTWLFAIFGGVIGDRIYRKNNMTLTDIRKLLTGISSFGPGLCFIFASFEACHRYTVTILLTLGMVLNGCFYPGVKINTIELSPNHAGTLQGIVNTFYSICGIMNPYFSSLLTTDNTLAQWRRTFWLCFYIINATFLVYLIYGSAEVQSLNNIRYNMDDEDEFYERPSYNSEHDNTKINESNTSQVDRNKK